MSQQEQKEALESANELNIDNFFGVDAGFVAKEESETDESEGKESGEAINELDTSEDITDEDSQEDETVDEDDIDNEDSDEDSDEVDPKALSKKAQNAEKQRREMQSDYDKLMARFNQQTDQFTQLSDKVRDLETKQNSVTVDEIFTGDDDNVMTERQGKELLAHYANAAKTESHNIGTDQEAQQMWANAQPDVTAVSDYLQTHSIQADPVLSGMTTVEGKYVEIRNRLMESKMKALATKVKKQEKLIKKMKKGPIPDTSNSGNRGITRSQKSGEGDHLDNFFGSY